MVRVKHYGAYAQGAHLWTTRGDDAKDYYDGQVLKGKGVIISGTGGISTGRG